MKALPNSHISYRPDIDGLRAIAILIVVIFHAFPQLIPGGFIGVDIFFVISGYLITSNILKSMIENRFTLIDFYVRRIKRIFPALLVVLSFCLIVGWFTLFADEYKELGKHISASAGYVLNFLLMRESGYFDRSSDLKPLLHLWSLCIEEQFYLIWPLMLMLTLRNRINTLFLILLMITISFLLNVLRINEYPVNVFYMPSSRAWEFLFGSLLAYASLYKRLNLSYKKVNAFAWCGFLFICLAAAGSNEGLNFPGWWALLPTLGTSCLIIAGERAWFNKNILANKTAVWIGLISYPLYLWHWPLLSFAHIIEGKDLSTIFRLTIIVLSTFLAWFTYLFVEKRLRFIKHWTVAVGLFCGMVVFGLFGFLVFKKDGFNQRYPTSEYLSLNLGQSSWEKHNLIKQADCLNKFGKEFTGYCVIHDINSPPTVVLIGDSTANHFFPGLADSFSKTNNNLLNLGQGACPPFLGINVTVHEGNLHCAAIRDKAFNFAIKNQDIHTVVLSLMGAGYINKTRDVSNNDENGFVDMKYDKDLLVKDPVVMLEKGMRETFQLLLSAGKKVVFIIGVPMLNFDPALCVNFRPTRIFNTNLKEPCVMSREVFNSFSGKYIELVMRVTKDFPNVKVLNTTSEFCDDKYCWAIKNGTLLYRDPVHLSEDGSRYIADRLFSQLELFLNFKDEADRKN